VWSDGLQEVADLKGVSELSVACALQRAKSRNERLAEIEQANDDILVADIELPSRQITTESFRPLILAEYRGNQADEIDVLQAFWQRSVGLAAPEIPEQIAHDFLLASREALLNALCHGCCGRDDAKASFQVAYCAFSQIIRVRVVDPGPGHNFNVAAHENDAAASLVEKHRGLILIKHLANRVIFEREGASLTMDFK
jgi:anti-sigma regulatory factor (Ser/Thr protein kinase)